MRHALRVLVVDDERTIADSLSLILRARGHIAHAAYTPEAALEITNEFEPEVLISDVVMPNMDGIELARRLRSRFPPIRTLLISGNETVSTMLNDARRHGPDFAFMQKPVPPTLIIDFVDSCRNIL